MTEVMFQLLNSERAPTSIFISVQGGGGDTVVSPAIPPEDATSPRDDNREVGGQTIVYLRASPRSSASHYIVARVHQLFRHRHQSWPKVSMSCPA